MELGFGILFDPEFANAAMSGSSLDTPTPAVPGLAPTNSNKDGTTANLSGGIDAGKVIIEQPFHILYPNFGTGHYTATIRKGDLATITDVSWLSGETPIARGTRSRGGAGFPDPLIYDDSSATFDTSQIDSDFYGVKMHLKVSWTVLGSSDVKTYHGPVFKLEGGVRPPADDSDEDAFKRTLSNEELNGVSGDRITADTAGVGSSGPTSSNPGTTGTNNTIGGGDSALPSASIDSGGGGGGGLSKGAIAGIAVGCGLVFLIALGLLAWFLWRRRRRDVDHVKSAAYDGRMGTHDYMNDKETQGRVAESPHSPYSDDGLRRDSALLHDVHAPPTAQDRSFAPYSDAAPAQQADPPTQAARDATPQQGVPTAMAHLVEDGMTQDEIRRLEEEERALDRAIEQAGHR